MLPKSTRKLPPCLLNASLLRFSLWDVTLSRVSLLLIHRCLERSFYQSSSDLLSVLFSVGRLFYQDQCDQIG